MLHISNHLGSEHQKHNELSTHTCQNGYYQKTTNNKCWQGCGEKGTLMHCWWDCKFVKSLWKTVWKFLRKLNRITILSSSYISECYLKEKNTNLKRYVHYNTISNSQNKGVTQKSIQRWMVKYIYIYIVLGSIPGPGRSPGEGNSYPFQYSGLETPTDRGAWWAMVHRVTKSQTWLKWLSSCAYVDIDI